jgi:hypothetical protein
MCIILLSDGDTSMSVAIVQIKKSHASVSLRGSDYTFDIQNMCFHLVSNCYALKHHT